MSRRQQPPGLEFGSDSFLDVVCNIVGILIILIVVVSVKVQRQPNYDADLVAAQLDRDAQEKAQKQQLTAQNEELQAKLKSREELQAGIEELQAKQSVLQIDIAKLEETITELEELIRIAQAADQKTKEKQNSVAENQRLLSVRVASLEKTLDAKNNELKALSASMNAAETEQKNSRKELDKAVIETQKLTEVLETKQKASEPTDKLQHRLMPVTRTADHGEIHFRISNGRISEFPIEGLLQRLKRQVQTAGYRDLNGVVGPVGGYRMTYALEKVGSNGIQALQTGEYSLSLQLSRWQIDPDESLVEETFDEAVRPGSHFRNVIQSADVDAVVTLWIYPDSFAGFHAVREVAHGLNMRVAARPLPFGQPIVGSQSGSKSNSQ
jgi:hypothetical protein